MSSQKFICLSLILDQIRKQMRFSMSGADEKKTSVDVPNLVTSQPEALESSGKSRKKYIIIAVASVVGAALVLVAILVGMYLFTEAQKEILKFSLNLKGNMTQDVKSNPNTNIAQYHVKEKEQESWIVNDYNSDLSVIKIQSKTQTNCYVVPLNETNGNKLPDMKSSGTPPDSTDTVHLVYQTGASPIPDTSFLSKTAQDTCKGISTYWLYPDCEKPTTGKNLDNITAPLDNRQKRAVIYGAWCGGYYYFSLCSFTYTCTLPYPYTYYYFTVYCRPCNIYRCLSRYYSYPSCSYGLVFYGTGIYSCLYYYY